ncbi:MAG: hypothetical protein D6788_09500, partial [Planctomycetota bacterium]
MDNSLPVFCSAFGSVAGIVRPPKLIARGAGKITVQGSLLLDGPVESRAEPGTSLALQGDFINRSSNPELFDWRDLLLILSGTTVQTFEVGANDLGQLSDTVTVDTAAFSIGTIQVNTGASVRFVDTFDNDPDNAGQDLNAGCNEAQYVRNLILQDGSAITLENVHLYAETLDQAPTAVVNPLGCGQLVVGTCPAAAPVEADPTIVPQNRYLAFVAGVSGNAGLNVALRVTFENLPAPFDVFNGQSAWVGEPVLKCENSGQDNVPPGGCAPVTGREDSFPVALLQCDPFYTDWSAWGTIHVTDDRIVPGGSYAVQAIAEGCETTLEGNFSTALSLTTASFGDVTGGCTGGSCSPPDGSVDV